MKNGLSLGYPFYCVYENSGDKIIGFGCYDGTSAVGVQIKNDNLLSDFGHVIAVSVGMKVAIYYNGVQQDSEDFSLTIQLITQNYSSKKRAKPRVF